MKELVLEFKDDTNLLNKWSLKKESTYIIGRNEEKADIVIPHQSISRVHACITIASGGSATIEDMDSANGTFVDGRQIKANQHVLLRKPAQIVLGEMTGVLILTEAEISEKGDTRSKKETKNDSKAEKDVAERESKKSSKRQRSRSRSQEKAEIKAKEEQNEGADDKKQKLWTSAADTEKKAKKWVNAGLNSEDQMKFLKLMGVKGESLNKFEKKVEEPKKLFAGFGPKKEDLNTNLEKQYLTGLFRKDGRKNGLGFGP